MSHFLFFSFLLDGFKRQAYFSLVGVYIEYFHRQIGSGFEDFEGAFPLFQAKFTHVNKALDTFLELEEYSEIGSIDHFTGYGIPRPHPLADIFPWILGKLFYTQAESLCFFIYIEHDRLDFLTFFEKFARMTDTLGPTYIRNMHESVYTFLDSNKYSKIGDVAYFALDDGSRGILF